MFDTSITVFTPTYNRAYTLVRLYKSLVEQEYSKLVWLIVDDGSTDNTEELIQQFISEKLIEINYYKQKNGGKQRAMNVGFVKCKTDLFMCVDSDDYLNKDAIKNIASKWEAEYRGREEIAGIISVKGKNDHEPLNTFLPDIKETKQMWVYTKYRFKGDLDLVYRTDVINKYSFHVFDDEKFIGETYVFNKIDEKYNLLVLNTITSICEYLQDGYTKNVRKLLKNNPKGYRLLKYENALHNEKIRFRFAEMIKYCTADIICGDGQGFKQCKLKLYYILAFLPGLIIYLLFYKNIK